MRDAARAYNSEQRDPTRRKPLFASLEEVHRDLPFYRFAARRALKDAGAESAVVVRTRRLSARELDAWMAAAVGPSSGDDHTPCTRLSRLPILLWPVAALCDRGMPPLRSPGRATPSGATIRHTTGRAPS